MYTHIYICEYAKWKETVKKKKKIKEKKINFFVFISPERAYNKTMEKIT